MSHMSELNNIGHMGNIDASGGDSSGAGDDGGGSGGGQNLYGDMFGAQGVFSNVEEIKNIEQTFSQWCTGSHNMTMLTFGLGSIFSTQNSFDLTSVSIFKFLDIGASVAGLSLPKVIGLPSSGRGK